MMRIQKNAFGCSMKILLSDIYPEGVACDAGVAGVAGLGDVLDDAVAAAETLKGDYYCHGNVVDFDSDDLRGVSLTF
jgi:hypothetical protein